MNNLRCIVLKLFTNKVYFKCKYTSGSSTFETVPPIKRKVLRLLTQHKTIRLRKKGVRWERIKEHTERRWRMKIRKKLL